MSLFFLGVLLSVAVDASTVGVYLALRFHDGEDLVPQDSNHDVDWPELVKNGFPAVVLALARLLVLPLMIRGGGQCGFARPEHLESDGQRGGGAGWTCCHCSAVPLHWLGFNFLLLGAATVLLLVLHKSWSDVVLWKLIVAGLAASLAQWVAVDALRRGTSKARVERHIYLESMFGLANSFDGNIADGGDGEQALLAHDGTSGEAAKGAVGPHGRVSLFAAREDEPEWLRRMRARVQEARLFWERKLDQLGTSLAHIAADIRHTMQRGHEISADDSVITSLLSLFAASDSDAVGSCLEMLNTHDEAKLVFYIPQLATFLLYGGLGQTSVQLQQWLLAKCASPHSGLHFAHRLHWFLAAHVLADGAPSGQTFDTSVTNNQTGGGDGSGAASDGGDTVQQHQTSNRPPGAISAAGTRAVCTLLKQIEHAASTPAFSLLTGDGPDERASPLAHPHKLLPPQQVKPDDRRFASLNGAVEESKAAAPDSPPAAPPSSPVVGSSTVWRSTALFDTAVLAPGRLPSADGGSSEAAAAGGDLLGRPSLGARSTSEPMLPLPTAEHAAQMSGRSVDDGTGAADRPLHDPKQLGCDVYNSSLEFIDALAALGRALIKVPRETRNKSLRRSLQRLGAHFLPSNAIYLPVGEMRHRVYGVHPEECFAFSTKERVPFLVCLEVVDYARAEEEAAEAAEGPRDRAGSGDRFWSTLRMGPGLSDKLDSVLATMRRGAIAHPTSPPRHNTDQDDVEQGVLAHKDTSLNRQDLPQDYRTTAPRQARLSSAGSERFVSCAETPVGSLGQWRVSVLAEGPHSESHGGPESLAQPRQSSGGWTQDGAGMSLDSAHGTRGAVALLHASPGDEPSATPPSWQAIQPPPTTAAARGGGRGAPVKLHDPTTGAAVTAFDGTSPQPSPAPLPPLYPPPDAVGDEESKGTASPLHPPQQLHQPATVQTKQQTSPSPARVLFRENWAEKEMRLRKSSPVGHLPGWRLLPVIIKSNDDLRQEAFAAQLIQAMARVLKQAHGEGMWVKAYGIVATASDAGVIEAVADTVSLDALKRNDAEFVSLHDFFVRYFTGPQRRGDGVSSPSAPWSAALGGGGGGGGGSGGGEEHDSGRKVPSFQEAQTNFIKSLAPYCIICFLLQLKDRHNGNILLDALGHILHIDFGFLFMSSPGGNLNFESAPFKLTDEMVALMGGPRSFAFQRFRDLCVKAYLSLRRHAHQMTLLVDMMIDGHGDLPCWQGRPMEAAEQFRQRFRPDLSDAQAIAFVHDLIDSSMNNWRTNWALVVAVPCQHAGAVAVCCG